MPIQEITVGLVSEICEKYPDLAVLNLSDNEIKKIENLEPLRSLTRLNVSGNRICVSFVLQLMVNQYFCVCPSATSDN